MAMIQSKVLSGVRCLFNIEGVKCGWASSVSLGESVEYQPVEVLNNIRVEEHVPVAYRVTNFSARKFRIVGETLKSLGYFPKVGNSTDEHLLNVLTTGVLSATLEDTVTGTTIATITDVRVQDHNYTVDARGIVGEDITFVAITVKDESETAA